mgnify:CR=1 FL=1
MAIPQEVGGLPEMVVSQDTVRGVKHKSHEELTLLELVLQLHGEFRSSLEPIREMPLQAGVLLFLRRHVESNVRDTEAALGVSRDGG